MSPSQDNRGSDAQPPGRFATTRWSIVLEAGHSSSPDSQKALATLCETYWYPLYAYVRRRVLDVHEAQDLTQGFFAVLLEKDYLRAADRDKGRFRSFLLTAFKRFLSKERDRAKTQKRGGGQRVISLDFESGEKRYKLEPLDDWTPEKIFERRWALTLLDQVLARLERDYADKRKLKLFEALKGFLTGRSAAPSYDRLAGELDLSEGSVKVAVHRLRRRYRKLLKEEIANTVADPDEIQDELDHLLSALRGEK